MKSTLVFLALNLLSATALATTDNFSEDLKTPFTKQSEPFVGMNEVELSQTLSTNLLSLLGQCGYVGIVSSSDLVYITDAAVDADALVMEQGQSTPCHDLVQLTLPKTIYSFKSMRGLKILDPALGLHLTIVAWDGRASDPTSQGNTQAIGVYDSASGTRIAFYRNVEVGNDGNVLDGIAKVLRLNLRQVNTQD